jgi:hypothetical protein
VNHTRDPDTAAGAGDVLDDHRLAERAAHALGQDAGKDFGAAPGSERHHHGDGARRKIFGARQPQHRGQRDSAGGRAQEIAPVKFLHCTLIRA